MVLVQPESSDRGNDLLVDRLPVSSVHQAPACRLPEDIVDLVDVFCDNDFVRTDARAEEFDKRRTKVLTGVELRSK
jgi:hypothetical protein